MSRDVVLDASALLAALFSEPGVDVVFDLLGRAAISAVNYSEVIAKQMQRGVSAERAVQIVANLNLLAVPWDMALSEAAADLSSLGWTHGLSLGDRACLATARKMNRTVLTAERQWKKLPKLGIDIQVIR